MINTITFRETTLSLHWWYTSEIWAGRKGRENRC
uniref:Uncharacterized protein n=1 Tax=Arundo donax TaxID=35708 RepID=A0A0A8ZNC2_ARUDO